MSEADRIPCPVCGKKIMPTARVCRFCGERIKTGGRRKKTESDATGGVIPYKNVPALVAYYCGVFSIIPCFPIGIVAVVLGIMGLRKAKQQPEVRGQVHAWVGIIAGGLFGLLWTAATVMAIASGVFGNR